MSALAQPLTLLRLIKIWRTLIQQNLHLAGTFAPDELHAGILFNHIRQIVSIVDANAKSLVSDGEAACRVGSRWALPRTEFIIF